jgi:hypothetical protein
MRNRRFLLILIGAAALGAVGVYGVVRQVGPAAQAAAPSKLAQPKDKPILTMTGQIGVTNQSGAAVFDRAMLESLGLVAIETQTPWYANKVRFEGVPMSKLLQVVGASGQKLSVTALNDYKTDIPVEDFKRYNAILALKRDGQYMPVSDKGPLFIVYPYDAHAELKSQKFYGRSAWQVARIEVK